MNVTITLWHILAALLAMAGGAGTLGALVATGVAQRLIVPLVRAEILAHEASAATVEGREKATARVIDDHLRRDDGLIYQRLSAQDTRLNEALREAFEQLREAVIEQVERLSRIEGLLQQPAPERPRSSTPTPLPGALPGPLKPLPPRRPPGGA